MPDEGEKGDVDLMTKRIEAYDIARGVGIILVVIGHSVGEATLVHRYIYAFHMPLFFLISGLVMKPVRYVDSGFKLGLKRLLASENKLLAFYLLGSIIFIIFDLVIRVGLLHVASWKLIVFDIYQTLVFQGVNVLWFIATLYLVKLLTRLLASIKVSRPLLVLLSVCGFMLVGLHWGYLPQSIMGSRLVYTPISGILRVFLMLPFCLLGHLYRSEMARLFSDQKGVISVLGFVMVALLLPALGSVDYHTIKTGVAPIALIAGALGSIAVLGFGTMIHSGIIYSILQWFSRYSFFIMFTHEYLGLKSFLIDPLIGLLSMPEYLRTWVEIVVLLVVEVPVCLLLSPCFMGIVTLIEKRVLSRKAES